MPTAYGISRQIKPPWVERHPEAYPDWQPEYSVYDKATMTRIKSFSNYDQARQYKEQAEKQSPPKPLTYNSKGAKMLQSVTRSQPQNIVWTPASGWSDNNV